MSFHETIIFGATFSDGPEKVVGKVVGKVVRRPCKGRLRRKSFGTRRLSVGIDADSRDGHPGTVCRRLPKNFRLLCLAANDRRHNGFIGS